MFRCGARILVEGDIIQNSYMIPLSLYCNGVAKIRFEKGETFRKNVHIEDLRKFLKIYKKNLHKNLINSQKFFKDKI